MLLLLARISTKLLIDCLLKGTLDLHLGFDLLPLDDLVGCALSFPHLTVGELVHKLDLFFGVLKAADYCLSNLLLHPCLLFDMLSLELGFAFLSLELDDALIVAFLGLRLGLGRFLDAEYTVGAHLSDLVLQLFGSLCDLQFGLGLLLDHLSLALDRF